MKRLSTYISILLCTLVLVSCGGSEELVQKSDSPDTPDYGSSSSSSGSTGGGNSSSSSSSGNTGNSSSSSSSGGNTGSSSSSSSSGGQAQFDVTLNWSIPENRSNGEELLTSEIGGYEIVYKLTSDSSYSVLQINDQSQTQTTITDLSTGNYEFRIAAFDTDGIYSDFSEPTYEDVGS